MSKNGFVDKSLIGLKDKLKHQPDVVSLPKQEPPPVQIIEKPKEIEKTPGKSIDKEFVKLQKRRKEEYLKDKKYVISKINTSINMLKEKKIKVDAQAAKLSEDLKKMTTIETDLTQLAEDKWDDEDFSNELLDAIKKVENARMEYLLFSKKYDEIAVKEEEVTAIKKEFSVNELMSMTFIQLFKIGLKFLSPLIIGMIIASLILALAILAGMGTFKF